MGPGAPDGRASVAGAPVPPGAHVVSESHRTPRGPLALRLAIDGGGVVASLGFECHPDDAPALGALAAGAEGRGAEDVLAMRSGSPDPFLFLLQEALRRWRSPRPAAPEKGDLLCRCFNVSEGEVRLKARELGLSTTDQATEATRAGGGCTSCLADVKRVLDGVRRAARGGARGGGPV